MVDNEVIVRAEALSKSYLIGHSAARGASETFREMLSRQVGRLGRMTLDMARGRQIVQGDSIEEFWALKDVSFDIRQGEVVGVIGRNGAGKSTLLKVLSRITDPTQGRASIKGRVASLLEVGTGFHPELTGRENIFLNGAILGMSRVEIKARFDEIVEFAEVAKFLDTPVKRYSSGMYVRLAFAVAAHLNPEVLIIDEVLAVGDSAFQRKCLGKMNDISGAGRTILFVSHNMQAVRQLCQRVIWLENGRVRAIGPTEQLIDDYLASEQRTESIEALNAQIAVLPADPVLRLEKVDVRQDGQSTLDLQSGKPIELRFDYEVLKDTPGFHMCFSLCDLDGTMIFDSLHNGAESVPPFMAAGRYVSTAEIPADFLAGRGYELLIEPAIQAERAIFSPPLRLSLQVHNAGLVNRAYPGYNTPGKVAPLIPWRTQKF